MEYNGQPAYSAQYPNSQYPVAPVIVVPRRYGDWFPKTSSTVLGALLLILGIGSVITGGLFVAIGVWGHGVWCGIFTIIAGSVAMATKSRPENSMVNATAAMSFFAFFFALTQLGTSATLLSAAVLYCDGLYNNCPGVGGYIALFAFSVAFASLTFILGLWLFIIACKAVCHSSASVKVAPVDLQVQVYPTSYPSMGVNQMAPVEDTKGY